MASTKIKGITIQIGAETSKVNEALKNINKAINSTKNELKDVDRLLKLDPSNTTLLAQKQKLLGDAINQTKTKLETLNEAYKLGLNNDAVDKSSRDWEQLCRQIEETKIKLNDFQNQQEKLGSTKIDAGIDAESISKGFDKASESALSFGDVLKANISGDLIVGGIKTLVNGIKQVGSAIVDTVKDSGAFADDINTMAKQFNLSTSELQAFSRAAELIDVDLSTITKSMSKLTKNMSSSSEGIVSSFEKLGIATKNADGSLRDSNTVFFETIDALGKITDETEQDSLALQIFGKSAAELGTLINGGANELKNLTAELNKNGLILNQKELNSLNKINDSFDKMNMSMDAFKDKMVSKLAPVIQPILDSWVSSTDHLISLMVDGTFEETEALKDLNIAMVDSLKASEEMYQSKQLSYDLGLSEARMLDEYIDKYKDANKTEEESYWLKERLKEGVDKLNESLGINYYHWDDEKQAIVDINGNVVQLTESYKSLANESKKAMWLESNKQAYQDAIEGLQTVQTKQKEAYDKYAEALEATGTKSSEALDIINNRMAEFNKAGLTGDTDLQKNIVDELGLNNWQEAVHIISQLTLAQQNLINATEEGTKDTNMFNDIINGYDAVSNAEADVATNMINNFNQGFGYVDELTTQHIPMLLEKMATLKSNIDANMQNEALATNEYVKQQTEEMKNQFDSYDQTLKELSGKTYEEYLGTMEEGRSISNSAMEEDTEGNKTYLAQLEEDAETTMDNMAVKAEDNVKKSKEYVDTGVSETKSTLLGLQKYCDSHPIIQKVKIEVDSSALSGYTSNAYRAGGSGGFGINSSGFGITLHNTINVNNSGKTITQEDVNGWGKDILDVIDRGLGCRV